MKTTNMILAVFAAGAMLAGDKPRVVNGVTVPTNKVEDVRIWFDALDHATLKWTQPAGDPRRNNASPIVRKGDVLLVSFTTDAKPDHHQMLRIRSVSAPGKDDLLVTKPGVVKALKITAATELLGMKFTNDSISPTIEIYRP